MRKTLKSKKILITRPRKQALPFFEEIVTQGGTPILFPTIEIIPLFPLPDFKKIKETILHNQIGIVVSANAVEFIPEETLQSLSTLTETITMGITTATALQSKGVTPTTIMPNGATSETILEYLASNKLKLDLPHSGVVLFTGLGGRQHLQQELAAKGVKVTRIETYKRICPNVATTEVAKIWMVEKPDYITVTSQDILINLVHIFSSHSNDAKEWLIQQPLVVVSQRIEAYAKQHIHWQGPILLAKSAQPEEMVAAMVDSINL